MNPRNNNINAFQLGAAAQGNQKALSWDADIPPFPNKNQNEEFSDEEEGEEDDYEDYFHAKSQDDYGSYYYGDSGSDNEDDQVQDYPLPNQTKPGQQQQNLDRKTTKELDEVAVSVNTQYNVPSKSRTFPNFIKLLVSKEKKRYESNEFSLDLTYITPNVIAMGFPASKFESLYRNDRDDVKNFFNKKHEKHYKIYNLCTEREYKRQEFEESAYYPFEDHQAPEFQLMFDFCKDLFNYIHKDSQGLNTAGVHCKAGKGRTGVMICCYLMYSGFFDKATDALRYYGLMRTKNKKGVTIPSQIRYVQYFEKALHCRWKLENFPNIAVKIMKIKLITIPNFNLFGGCEPYFTITYSGIRSTQSQDQKKQEEEKITFSSLDYFKLQKYTKEAYIEFVIGEYTVKGDVLVQFFNKTIFKKKEKMFQFWFNCAFFESNGVMVLEKDKLDCACKDLKHKNFSDAFYVEVHGFHPAQDEKIEVMPESYIQINREIDKKQKEQRKLMQAQKERNQPQQSQQQSNQGQSQQPLSAHQQCLQNQEVQGQIRGQGQLLPGSNIFRQN